MALIDCPDCGREVSVAAKTCPNCGHPFQPTGFDAIVQWARDHRNLWIVLGVVGVLIVVTVAVVMYQNAEAEEEAQLREAVNRYVDIVTGE